MTFVPDPIVGVNFDGALGMTFTQGESRTILLTLFQMPQTTPIDLTDAVVGLNLPLQGGGSIKRTTGVVAVPFSAVVITPANQISLTDHGFVTGDPVTVAAQGGGTLPSGLAALTNYLILVIDVNTFQFTNTAGNVIALTTKGTVGFNIANANDLQITTDTFGQVTLNLRPQVSAAVYAALAQTFQVQYEIDGYVRIVLIENQLDCYAQPTP